MPDQPRFGLPAQPQQNEIVARQNGVDHLRHDGVFVSQDAGKQRLPALHFADQIVSEFVFDGAVAEFGFGKGLWRSAPRVRGNS